MKRSRSETDPQSPFLVEPTSETVACDPAASTARTVSWSVATGVATSARSASSTARASESAGESTAPRSTATASEAASASQPATCETPARLAARPTEAPIRPVPTKASRSGGISAPSGDGLAILASDRGWPLEGALDVELGRTHELGKAERQVERLARVQAGVAERHVAGGELLLENGL